MSKRIALIHTVSGLTATFKKLSDELLPGVDVLNMTVTLEPQNRWDAPRYLFTTTTEGTSNYGGLARRT